MHFTEAMADVGAKRLRSEPNSYFLPGRDLHAMPCVVDILVVGVQGSSGWFCYDFPSSSTSVNYRFQGDT